MQHGIWSSKLALGVPSIDAAHRDLLDVLTQLSELPDKEFGGNFSAWVAKVEIDFYAEEQLMEEIDFPGIRPHIEQDARVLSALHHAEPRVMEGDVAIGREAIALLPQWFEFMSPPWIGCWSLRCACRKKIRCQRKSPPPLLLDDTRPRAVIVHGE